MSFVTDVVHPKRAPLTERHVGRAPQARVQSVGATGVVSVPQKPTAAAAVQVMAPPCRSACSACRERGGKSEVARLMDGATGSDVELGPSPSGTGGTWADVYALPPLPTPDYCAMRGEATCGNSLVLFLIFLFVAPMQTYASQTTTPLTPLMRIWIGAIYAEAVTAIICLLGLMWGDPGTIKRSPETSFPLPELVSERLRNGTRAVQRKGRRSGASRAMNGG